MMMKWERIPLDVKELVNILLLLLMTLLHPPLPPACGSTIDIEIMMAEMEFVC